jgi:hypothetical protein
MWPPAINDQTGRGGVAGGALIRPAFRSWSCAVHVVDLVIFAGWIAFWIYWLAASVGVKAGQTRWTRFAGIRIGVLLLVLLLLRVKAFKGHVATNDPWLQGIGLAIFLPGLALAIWARVYLELYSKPQLSEKKNNPRAASYASR